MRRETRLALELSAFILVLFGLSASLLAAGSGSGTPEPSEKSARKIAWDISLDRAIKEAAEENKLVMAYFYPTDFLCPACEMLKSTTFPDAAVIAESEKFINVKVDATHNTRLATRYQVSAYPSIKFINAEGQLVHSSEGYVPPREFIAQMDKAVRVEAEFRRLVAKGEKNPKDAKLQVEVGEQFQQRGAFAKAKERFAQAESIDPDDKLGLRGRIRLNQARLAIEENRPADARKLLKPIVKAGGKQAPFAAYMLAISYIFEAQQLDAAATKKEDAAKVVRLQQKSIDLLKDVANTYPDSDWGRRAAAIIAQMESHEAHNRGGSGHE